MSKIIYISEFQKEVIFSEEQFNIILHSAGGGTTFALLIAAHEWCESNPNKFVTFFCPQSQGGLLASGGVFEQAKELFLALGYKCSSKSLVFTHKNGAKIKLQYSLRLPIEYTQGLARDFIIFDVGCPKELILKHFLRARKIIVADYLEDIKLEGSWCKTLKLLTDEGFSPLLNVIKSTGVESNTSLVECNPRYIDFLNTLPKDQFTRLTNTEL